jgi:hypothetical protein
MGICSSKSDKSGQGGQQAAAAAAAPAGEASATALPAAGTTPAEAERSAQSMGGNSTTGAAADADGTVRYWVGWQSSCRGVSRGARQALWLMCSLHALCVCVPACLQEPHTYNSAEKPCRSAMRPSLDGPGLAARWGGGTAAAVAHCCWWKCE